MSAYIFLLVLGISSAQLREVDGEGFSQSSFSLSESTFETSLLTAIETSISELESNPKNLDKVLENIAVVIFESLEIIAGAIIGGDGINYKNIQLDFGTAVNASLYMLIQVDGLQNLDVESVASQVTVSTKNIIEEVDGSSEVSIVAKDLGNAIIGAIGDGISEVTGNSFTYKIEIVPGSTPTAISSTSNSASSPSVESNLIVLLQNGKIQLVVQQIEEEVASSTSTSILEFFVQASATETLTPSLIDVFITIFADANFDFEILGDILVESSKVNEDFSYIISEAIIAAAEKNNINGLAQLISIAFQSQSSLSTLLLSAIEGAIVANGCTSSLGTVLIKSKEASSDESSFEAIIASNANVSSCLTDSELEAGDFDTAFEVLAGSDIDTIISTFAFAIRAGQQSQVSQFLEKFFESEAISTQNLTALIGSFLQQTPPESSSLMIEAIQSTSDVSSLLAVFRSVLTGTNTEYIDTFVGLIASSVTDKTCGFEDIIDQVLADSSSSQVKTIIGHLVVGGAEDCIADYAIPISESVLVPAPEPTSSTPVVAPFLEAKSTPVSEIIPASNSELMVSPIVNPIPAPVTAPIDEKCTDIPPPGNFTCAQQKNFEKCKTSWMIEGKYCKNTCGNCDLGEPSSRPISAPNFRSTSKNSPTPALAPGSNSEFSECSDIVPPGGYSCSEQAKFGKCQRLWMQAGGFCAKTCGYCCKDISPPGKFTCAQQKQFGKCKSSWMIEGNYCRKTCGYCDLNEPSQSPILTLTRTPSLGPIIEEMLSPKLEGHKSCDCGCDAAFISDLTETIVREVVSQVLVELRK